MTKSNIVGACLPAPCSPARRPYWRRGSRGRKGPMGDAADDLTDSGLDALARHQMGECEEPCQYCDEEERKARARTTRIRQRLEALEAKLKRRNQPRR